MIKRTGWLLLLFFVLLCTGLDTLGLLHIQPEGDEMSDDVRFPPSTHDWELKYRFIVPPLPRSSAWDPGVQVLYLWGDVDFDKYGPGPAALSPYRYNQILPQLMIGNALSENDRSYRPAWKRFDHWVIQASYYWGDGKKISYAQTGDIVAAEPGETITSSIRYSAKEGTITVQISGAAGMSMIRIARPFPNEQKPLSANWKSFFEKAEGQSKGLYGHPDIAVEPHGTDSATVCSILPFKVLEASISGVPLDVRPFKATRRCGDKIREQIEIVATP